MYGNWMMEGRKVIVEKINRFSAEGRPFVFCVDFAAEKGFAYSPEESLDKGFRYSFGRIENEENRSAERLERFDICPVEFAIYEKSYSKVKHHLELGDTYLLNLTFPTPVECNLSLTGLFEVSNAPFKMMVPGHFVVFSPESFVRIGNGRIVSNPMKGTIDASLPGAEEQLLADEKERYEHNTIVDLIRNDLAMVAINVRVERFRYLERIQTHRGALLQMSSEISGTLPGDYRERLGEILFTLLPAGSVTGAPKERTVEIIRAAEMDDRSFYTGIFGYFDGRSLTSAVAIRYIEQTPNGLVFRSGGGITALSDAESEYREMISKVYVPVV